MGFVWKGGVVWTTYTLPTHIIDAWCVDATHTIK
ncbi:hypothetical protein PC110_g20502 [Phytophthora cactorum]|uniref:Uncharacterized protein n=1 Tax=Phytophthora cactorum TaxID=29920 RepID=A0A329RFC2_9STRA|nr:hypothetical protein PC110_g20502 [Phytophthora cactorum]